MSQLPTPTQPANPPAAPAVIDVTPTGEPDLPAVIDTDHVIDSDGEQVPLSMVGVDTIAAWVEQLRDARKNIDRCVAILSAEAIRRADAAGGKTRLAGQRRWVGVTGAAATPRYDIEALGRILSSLVVADVLTHEAIDGIVTSETVWKVDTARVKQLCKVPRVAEAVKAAAIEPEQPTRRITGTGWKD